MNSFKNFLWHLLGDMAVVVCSFFLSIILALFIRNTPGTEYDLILKMIFCSILVLCGVVWHCASRIIDAIKHPEE